TRSRLGSAEDVRYETADLSQGIAGEAGGADAAQERLHRMITGSVDMSTGEQPASAPSEQQHHLLHRVSLVLGRRIVELQAVSCLGHEHNCAVVQDAAVTFGRVCELV